jgi:hypothetical protein
MVEDIFDISVIVKCSSFHSVPSPSPSSEYLFIGVKNFSAPYHPDRLWDPSNLLSNGALSREGGEAAGGEADHSPPRSAKVKKTWLCTSTPSYSFMA